MMFRLIKLEIIKTQLIHLQSECICVIFILHIYLHNSTIYFNNLSYFNLNYYYFIDLLFQSYFYAKWR